MIHNISKNWTQRIYRFWVMADLGFFTFLFFILKISRIKPCEYNKSCSIFHHESNKIEFAIFWNFYDFLRILQVSANCKHYWSFFLRRSPWKFLQIHNHTLTSQKTPQKNYKPCNVVPGHRPAAVRPNSGKLAAGRGRRRTRGVWCLDFARSSKWWGRQRGCTADATGACCGAPLFRRGGATAAATGGRRASVGARGGAGMVVRRREGARDRARRGRAHGDWAARLWAGGRACASETSRPPFCSRPARAGATVDGENPST
jgi:hypothetical protein